MKAAYRKQASASVDQGVRLEAAMTLPVPDCHGEGQRQRQRSASSVALRWPT
jgi:hypothetical protein